ncbi:peptide chain release factor 3 [Sanyastnella coralliicola]|uniref:peptide chain release factor 3 n=1 Tax=Sanyastnella coralliicola TaxID=3069118 RepID=UPI0027BB1275|nr:peptide chain release factor 3 [Longitalea sp. SCSIO 12813]
MSLNEEINKRKTFAIISHPDAGKTTLTEKFLLFGGAIQTAGAVKNNKITKTAASDFMDIERQRGISVATSVMGFEYKGLLINLLDTPGHKDFAEDTYRTLTAVDSVILVVDSVKGVEEQTKRLMEVCRMRDTPVIIFVNKVDLEGRDPFDLLDELESMLNINVRPLSWPISKGYSFKGVYDLYNSSLKLFEANKTKVVHEQVEIKDLDDPQLDELVGEHADQLREDVDLIQGVYEEFEDEEYLQGKLAPVFFGSAVNNFGVQEMLDTFVRIAPVPQPRPTDVRDIAPDENKFTGFVFKIHANIDPKHRDRIAFLRVCSGKFERNKFFNHVRLEKKLKFANPATFMARSKNVVDEAFPGDVVGLYDTGNFKIGDTLTEGEALQFQGIPSFSPEIFKELVNLDPMKSKQLDKGIKQLTDEGVAQLFIREAGSRKIVGTVGELQFEVIQYRLEHEYGAKCEFRPKNYFKACWLTTENEEKLEEFKRIKALEIVQDKDGNDVYLAPSQFLLDMERQNFPEIEFHFTSEFKTAGVN